MSKYLSLLIVIIFSFGSFAFAETLKPIKPGVTFPKLDLKDFKINVPKNGKFWLGDWNSSGAPQPPYDPEYEFLYQCQAQLTDAIYRTDDGGKSRYQFYAIATFEMKNDATSVESEKLEWTAQKYFNTSNVQDTNEQIPFSTNGNYFGLSMKNRGGKNKDEVFFYASLTQLDGPLSISANSRESIRRDENSIELYVETNVQHRSNPDYPSMRMRLLCYKAK